MTACFLSPSQEELNISHPETLTSSKKFVRAKTRPTLIFYALRRPETIFLLEILWFYPMVTHSLVELKTGQTILPQKEKKTDCNNPFMEYRGVALALGITSGVCVRRVF